MKPSRSALPTEASGPSCGSSRAILLRGWLASSLSLVSGSGSSTAAGCFGFCLRQLSMAACCCSRVPAVFTASARPIQPPRSSVVFGCNWSVGSEAINAQIVSWFLLAASPLSIGAIKMRSFAAASVWPSASRARARTVPVRICCSSGNSPRRCMLGWLKAVSAAFG
ncbi:hypothetical protein D3C85_1162290 [compost metagenome]